MIKTKLTEIKRSKFVNNILILLFKLASLLPKKKNVIIFESFLGKQYSDNPKAIYLYLKENHPQYKMYWSVDRKLKDNFPSDQINILPRFGYRWMLIMSRAEYWVTNSRLPVWIPKPKGTTYIQTWHGTPLKRLALDMDEVLMPGTTREQYKQDFLKESAKWDYLVSPNRYSTEIFTQAFNFDKRIIESGYPRNDLLINYNKINEINKLKKEMNIPNDKKVILYAPTWRDNEFHKLGKYKFTLAMNIEKLYESLGDDYILLMRLHYLVADNLNVEGYRDFIYNMSDYEDINELYLVSDILITDYSSVYFDYGILNRPIIFYTYDIDTYRDKLRGFYIDFENEAPGPLVFTTEELIEEIKKAVMNGICDLENWFKFQQRFCYLEDGNASKRVVDEIFLSH